MSKIIKILDDFIIPFLKYVDVGNRDQRATKKWEEIKHDFVKQILAAQWIDGPPKDAGKGRFVLVYKDKDTGLVSRTIWDSSEDSLAFIIDFCGPVIKHMRLPYYA